MRQLAGRVRADVKLTEPSTEATVTTGRIVSVALADAPTHLVAFTGGDPRTRNLAPTATPPVATVT